MAGLLPEGTPPTPASEPPYRQTCHSPAALQTWQFNTPYQLTGPPKGFPKGFAIGDQPESSAMGKVQVEPGDVVVLGSDGLWDNLFPQQIADIVSAANAEGLGIRTCALHSIRPVHRPSCVPSPSDHCCVMVLSTIQSWGLGWGGARGQSKISMAHTICAGHCMQSARRKTHSPSGFVPICAYL